MGLYLLKFGWQKSQTTSVPFRDGANFMVCTFFFKGWIISWPIKCMAIKAEISAMKGLVSGHSQIEQ